MRPPAPHLGRPAGRTRRREAVRPSSSAGCPTSCFGSIASHGSRSTARTFQPWRSWWTSRVAPPSTLARTRPPRRGPALDRATAPPTAPGDRRQRTASSASRRKGGPDAGVRRSRSTRRERASVPREPVGASVVLVRGARGGGRGAPNTSHATRRGEPGPSTRRARPPRGPRRHVPARSAQHDVACGPTSERGVGSGSSSSSPQAAPQAGATSWSVGSRAPPRPAT